jgi:PX domain
VTSTKLTLHCMRTQLMLRPIKTLQLREELGKDSAAAQGLAPRWTPFSVAKKPGQIERRRRELEAWLWRLIGDPRTARSRVLNQFLELSDAARMARWAVKTTANSA